MGTFAVIGLIIGGLLAALAFGVCVLARAWVLRAVGKDDHIEDSATRPRVRTRIQHSPIETEIADVLAQDYAQRKRIVS